MTPTPPTPRRPGMTLTEVLVSLFVMALGLISLLTLFPVGAIQIGLALRDDRCKQTGVQADGFLRAYWKAHVTDPLAASASPDDLVWAMDSTTYAPTAYNTPAQPPIRTPASYPVLIDPLGYNARGALDPGRQSFADLVNPILPRRNIGITNTTGTGFTGPDSLRECVLLDDLTFEANGTPLREPPNTGSISRLGKYNWAAVIQRPIGVTARSSANLFILCFGDRPPLLDISSDEATMPVTVNPTSGTGPRVFVGQPYVRSVTLPTPPSGFPQLLRKGSWLMDPGTDNSATPVPVRNVAFYRVIGVNDNGSGSFDLDIDPPFVGPGAADEVITFCLFSGLTEVFLRPGLN